MLGHQFRPEFINRIDEIVVFHPLAQEQIKSIARIQLQGLVQRLEAMDYDVSVTDALLDKLASAGFDPLFGARPLKRAIQSKVEDPLAQAMLSGKVVPGKALTLDADDNGLVLNQ